MSQVRILLGALSDYRDLTGAVMELFSKHGIDYGRSHLGRKWQVTNLIERGVTVHKTADVVGHTDIKTTSGTSVVEGRVIAMFALRFELGRTAAFPDGGEDLGRPVVAPVG